MTINAQPRSKAAEAFDALIDMIGHHIEPDEFSRARFERAARESMSVDANTAYQVLGILATFVWDFEGVKNNFEQALRRNSTAATHVNYGRALAEMNDPRGAAEQLTLASKKEPENLGYLRSAIAYSFTSGAWSDTEHLIHEFSKRSQSSESSIDQIKQICAVSQEVGIIESSVKLSINCMSAFLREKRARIITFHYGTSGVAAEQCVFFEVQADVSQEEAYALDDELTPLLFDRVEDLQLDLFVLSISKASPSNATG